MRAILIAAGLAGLATAAAAQSGYTVATDHAMATPLKASVGQVADADVVDLNGREIGEVEHVLLNAAGAPAAVVVEIEQTGPDKLVVAPLTDFTARPEPGDDDGDIDLATSLTKAALAAKPAWTR